MAVGPRAAPPAPTLRRAAWGAACAVALALWSWGAAAQTPCSVLDSPAPPFQPGGSVFGLNSAQWGALFQGKVSANGGVACDLSVTGSFTLNGVPFLPVGGVWPPSNGGTGVNNGTSTITLGGSLSTAAALAFGPLSTAGQLLYAASPGVVGSTSALPGGTTATTQSTTDDSTLVATDAFVQGVLSGGSVALVVGSTPVSSGTNGALLYESSSRLQQVALRDSSVLVSNGTGIPSWSASLPQVGLASGSTINALLLPGVSGASTNGDCVEFGSGATLVDAGSPCGSGGGGGSVTSVGLNVNSTTSSGVFGVSGTPVTASGTINITLTGTSGGVPYFSSSSVLSSSGALAANELVLGGGSGSAPTSLATADNSILATSGSGVPSLTTTLPAAIQTTPGASATTATTISSLFTRVLQAGDYGTVNATNLNTALSDANQGVLYLPVAGGSVSSTVSAGSVPLLFTGNASAGNPTVTPLAATITCATGSSVCFDLDQNTGSYGQPFGFRLADMTFNGSSNPTGAVVNYANAFQSTMEGVRVQYACLGIAVTGSATYNVLLRDVSVGSPAAGCSRSGSPTYGALEWVGPSGLLDVQQSIFAATDLDPVILFNGDTDTAQFANVPTLNGSVGLELANTVGGSTGPYDLFFFDLELNPDNGSGWTATGTGSGTSLTLSAVTGYVGVGDANALIVGSGVPANTYIVSQSSGTPPNGAGVYVTNNATTSSSASLSAGSQHGLAAYAGKDQHFSNIFNFGITLGTDALGWYDCSNNGSGSPIDSACPSIQAGADTNVFVDSGILLSQNTSAKNIVYFNWAGGFFTNNLLAGATGACFEAGPESSSVAIGLGQMVNCGSASVKTDSGCANVEVLGTWLPANSVNDAGNCLYMLAPNEFGDSAWDSNRSFTIASSGIPLLAKNSNTGGTNTIEVYNTGVYSTTGTAAQLLAAISTTDGYVELQALGGSNPQAQLISGNGLTKGMLVQAGAGLIEMDTVGSPDGIFDVQSGNPATPQFLAYQDNPGATSTLQMLNAGTGASTVAAIVAATGSSNSEGFIKAIDGGQVQIESGNGNTGLLIASGAGGVYLAGLSTGGTYTQALCMTSGGSVQGDTSGTICGLSAARFKLIGDDLDPERALAGLTALRTDAWRYRSGVADGGSEPHVGLIADDVAAMDPRCGDYDADGRVSNYSDRCVEAYVVAATRALARRLDGQQAEIDDMRHQEEHR